ncbi:hypothetical protein EON63_06575 [archaeon]|nr:MAG: hypothetical protein EON63_06575 [archaeon]
MVLQKHTSACESDAVGSGYEEGGVVFLRQFCPKNDCSSDYVRDTVLFNHNPPFYYDDNEMTINRIKYGCSRKTGEIWIDFCDPSDAACMNSTHHGDLAQTGQCIHLSSLFFSS